MRNTFAYDIEKWIQSEEGQEDLRKTKAELSRLLDDPKTPKRRSEPFQRALRFIDLHLMDE